jgi:hypothetical protein
MTVAAEIKAIKGDRVMVRNYRRSNTWEPGVIWHDPETTWIKRDAEIYPTTQYTVRLDRERTSGLPILLYVGGAHIKSKPATEVTSDELLELRNWLQGSQSSPPSTPLRGRWAAAINRALAELTEKS